MPGRRKKAKIIMGFGMALTLFCCEFIPDTDFPCVTSLVREIETGDHARQFIGWVVEKSLFERFFLGIRLL